MKNKFRKPSQNPAGDLLYSLVDDTQFLYEKNEAERDLEQRSKKLRSASYCIQKQPKECCLFPLLTCLKMEVVDYFFIVVYFNNFFCGCCYVAATCVVGPHIWDGVSSSTLAGWFLAETTSALTMKSLPPLLSVSKND